jgi:ubiquinone/menaquinone biosynthesis C-methylase UbiE
MNKSVFFRNKLWNLTEEKEYNHAKRFYHRIKIIDNILLDKVYGNVLEVGCGGGRFLNKLRLIPNLTIWGLDISIDYVKLAHKEGFNVIAADGQKLPFKNEVFDTVTSANGSPKEMNLKLLLSEVYRVLKPAGFFAFDTYNKYPLEKIIKYKIMRLLKITNRLFEGISGGVENIKEFKNICSKLGFEIISLYTIFPLPFFPYGILLKGEIFSQINTHLVGIVRKKA